MTKKILPAKIIRGCVRVPGDKSISHRALMLAAIAQGESRITGLLQAEDVVNTRKMLEKLGMQPVEESNALIIQGCGTDGFAAAMNHHRFHSHSGHENHVREKAVDRCDVIQCAAAKLNNDVAASKSLNPAEGFNQHFRFANRFFHQSSDVCVKGEKDVLLCQMCARCA